MKGVLLLCTIYLVVASIVVCGSIREKRDSQGLSDEEHYKDGEHNVKYDHEAFLGKEGAKEFDRLTPEEAERRLGLIVDKIDDDHDGFVSHEELAIWITHVDNKRVDEYVNDRLPAYDANDDGKVTFEEYQQRQYGTVKDEDEIYDSHRQLTFKKAKHRDRRRFNMADQNGDEELDREEFAAFLHPNGVPHMKEIVISEMFEDKDTNHDGVITLEEHIDNIWPRRSRRDGEQEPEWVQHERELFYKHRDQDGDKKLNREELAEWMFPPDYDPIKAEVTHLIYHADTDEDNKLTKREILGNMDHFVGSRATEFGKYLNRHDEF